MMINNDEWWELTPSLIKGTPPPFNNRHPPPFLLVKGCDPSIQEICNYGDLWGLMLVFRGVQYFQRTHSCSFSGFGTKTRLECPDIHGRYIPAAARRDQRNQRRHRQKWLLHATKGENRRDCVLHVVFVCGLSGALLPAQKKVQENESVICDFPLEIFIKPSPIGWILGG